MLLCPNSTPKNSILFIKKLEFTPTESQEPITIIASIKFGENASLFGKVWKKLWGNQRITFPVG
jgi:hypothetical protein